jgi:predicted negative regulator of RcsB-dependent stress response
MLASYQADLAELHLELGRTEEALTVLEGIDSGIAGNISSVKVYAMRGEILRRHDAGAHAEEAERCLRRALEIARTGDAKLTELKIATSLARLLQDQDRCDEARALLAPVYDWFTEGFDTQDLKDAKALLEELG